MVLPEVTWTSLSIPNPDRKWWQFWKPRQVINPEALIPLFTKDSGIYDGIIFKEIDDAHS